MRLISDRLAKKKIRNIVWVLDEDEVGNQAKEVAKEVWEDSFFINLPGKCKDANDAVKAGYTMELGETAYEYRKRRRSRELPR